ncbi:Dyp-type peroxidase [Helcobacillus massiliensis]|uniref:Dyp-type peroxidase n=1 Tax=Helcobacillus massiliensis TaxID=521392 RepID=UPI002552F49E|nr:Dyp-type peroxidase [Helcobacillus massiliensis]MDK7742793.1 Dyp-type peroxidase [Helcobacillus massiliensis]WOO93445.1 Dyp-type peroxidase [Helcobacillus massiliensis]
MAATDQASPAEPNSAEPAPAQSGTSRRRLLTGGALTAAGLTVGGALGASTASGLLTRNRGAESAQQESPAPFGEERTAFYGTHQAGITEAPAAHAAFIAFTLKKDTDRDALARMMRIVTDDASRLTDGRAPLTDVEPELAADPSALTITVGFGPGFVERAGGAAPAWLKPLPAFEIDQLQDEFSGGDLLILVASDDPVALSHAQRAMLKSVRPFADLAWVQRGFRSARGAHDDGRTQRNLFGQVDGTVNPHPDEDAFDDLIWVKDGSWMNGGTSLVLRRIAMNMETWDEVDRPSREFSIGRRLDTGAPLTGTKEHDAPDYHAKTATGMPVIDDFSHMRRATSRSARERILRRPYNYDDAPLPGAESGSNTGLLFASYQADVLEQFLPIQQRLAEGDLLNTWTTPIGSAVFAIPPGCAADGFIGETLLS